MPDTIKLFFKGRFIKKQKLQYLSKILQSLELYLIH